MKMKLSFGDVLTLCLSALAIISVLLFLLQNQLFLQEHQKNLNLSAEFAALESSIENNYILVSNRAVAETNMTMLHNAFRIISIDGYRNQTDSTNYWISLGSCFPLDVNNVNGTEGMPHSCKIFRSG